MELKPIERLILWKLMVLGDGLMMKELPSSFTVKVRQRLDDAGLIFVEKRGRAKIVRLNEEKAWSWAIKNLDSEISKKAFFAGEVLQEILTRLKGFMERSDVPLAELLRPGLRISRPEDLEQQVKQAYLDASGGSWNVRVRLAILTRFLPDMHREVFSALLKKMQLEGKILLYAFDDPLENTTEDEAAAVRFSGEAYTIIYITG